MKFRRNILLAGFAKDLPTGFKLNNKRRILSGIRNGDIWQIKCLKHVKCLYMKKGHFFFLFSRLGQLHPMNNFFCRLCAYWFFLQGSIFLLNSTVTPFLRIKISDIRILISDLVHSCSILRTTHYAKTFVVLEKKRCQMNSRGKPMVFGL